MRCAALTCGLVLALLPLTACGAGPDKGNAAAETVVVTETETVDGSADSDVGVGTQAGGDADVETPVLPEVIGERLDVAESNLDHLGIAYEEIGGGTFGVVVASNWTVCDQRPGPGEEADSVELIIARPGDCDATTQQESGGGSDQAIPDLVGERLDVAEAELDDLGIAYEEIGGGVFGIIDRSAWEVCETQADAGDPAQVVSLIVDRPGDC